MVNYLRGTREIRTSSFDNYSGPLGVSIANYPPKKYKGPSYPPLMPPWSAVQDYKKDMIDVSEFSDIYLAQLRKLDAQKVYDELFSIHGENPVLLCWEEPGDFCHRQLVAEWLMKELGVEVNIT